MASRDLSLIEGPDKWFQFWKVGCGAIILLTAFAALAAPLHHGMTEESILVSNAQKWSKATGRRTSARGANVRLRRYAEQCDKRPTKQWRSRSFGKGENSYEKANSKALTPHVAANQTMTPGRSGKAEGSCGEVMKVRRFRPGQLERVRGGQSPEQIRDWAENGGEDGMAPVASLARRLLPSPRGRGSRTIRPMSSTCSSRCEARQLPPDKFYLLGDGSVGRR
jgi:hypothetical protein